jgi:glycosyltransferase involved in cell wall biosynthesis
MMQYVPALTELGIRCAAEPLLRMATWPRCTPGAGCPLVRWHPRTCGRIAIIARRTDADVVWLEKEALPWVPWPLERALTRLGVPIVVDIDDAVFHRYDRHGAALVRRLLGSKIDHLFAAAAAVTAGNDYLVARARSAGAVRVERIPTVVDAARYVVRPPPGAAPFTIGWVGSPATEMYLSSLAGVLREMVQRGARVLLVGASPAALPGLPVERRAWNADREASDIAEFDVGIMPLADSPWERGKCAYKIVQYMAAGRAVVASPIGANQVVVSPGEDGLLAGQHGGMGGRPSSR